MLSKNVTRARVTMFVSAKACLPFNWIEMISPFRITDVTKRSPYSDPDDNLSRWKANRGRVVKGVGHLDPCLKLRCAGGREFNQRPGQYSRMSFSFDQVTVKVFLIWTCLSFKILNLFRTLSSWGSSNYRPSAPFLYEVASHVKKLPFRPLLLIHVMCLSQDLDFFLQNSSYWNSLGSYLQQERSCSPRTKLRDKACKWVQLHTASSTLLTHL